MKLDPFARRTVGEQLRATASALERRHDRQRVVVGDLLDSPLSGLRGEVKDELALANGHVLAQHRRQPVGLVALGVVIRADTEEPEVEQPHRASENALSREVLRPKLSGTAAALEG